MSALQDLKLETEQAMKTQPVSLNEAFAARRAALVEARHEHFEKHPAEPDFAPFKGYCKRHNIHKPGEPRCGFDLVAFYGSDYPTAFITGCPHCGSSYCE